MVKLKRIGDVAAKEREQRCELALLRLPATGPCGGTERAGDYHGFVDEDGANTGEATITLLP